MSDEEEVVQSGEESEEESEAEEAAVEETQVEEEEEEDTGPTQAELVIKRRAPVKINESGLDEASKDILAVSRAEREEMETEIAEMRARNERRKKERLAEERKLAAQRNAEEQRRKAEEEERKKKKEDEERQRREQRDVKMAEFEKWKNPPQRNFVISKKEGGEEEEVEEEEDEEGKEKKSREQLEAEKKAILAQRLQPLDADSLDFEKLKEKAKELHNQIFRLEGDKYDLEKRWKGSQLDMMELAERARNMNKVGRGGLKRIQMQEEDSDKIQERFAGCPSKVAMYSKYERTKDKRSYVDRQTLYTGPQYAYATKKITPQRIVKWNEDTGLPEYEEVVGAAPAQE